MTSPWRDPVRLRRLYHGEGLTLQEVGDRLGCSAQAVLNWMERYDIPRRPNTGPGRRCPRWQEWAPFDHADSDGYERWQSKMDGPAYPYVHRLAAVAWFGYDAVVGSVIHHENGIPWDNREENLRPMSAADHTRLHATERADEAEQATSVACPQCDTEIPVAAGTSPDSVLGGHLSHCETEQAQAAGGRG